MKKPYDVPKKTVNLAFVGLSGRGSGLMKMVLDTMPDVQVIAVCDEYADRAEQARDIVKEMRGNTPVCTTDYRELLDLPELDGMVTPSAWDAHFEI
ncbi:MAG: gfo/Idh/MocA family oxidoreductase, partial [Clostridia bacterium]|nr:gfo/Idh/MocA family oxidoreductase [Clostridia bacterium]